ncbi:MAG: CRISPR-associated helicase Cas3' [Bacilli bacterium]|nr:CRISPR-associated helicase Cas3' [Bacilli bacterium]
MKIARKLKDGSVQLLTEHLESVAEHSKSIASKIGLGQISLLIGLLHDIGKFTTEFQDYIKNADPNDKKGSGIDHGVYGAKYIMEKLNGDMLDNVAAEIIAFVVCYHHGGLPDYLDKDYQIILFKRIDKIKANRYQDIFKEFELIFSKYNLEELISESSKEIKLFLNNINETIEDFNSKIFAIHMLIKTLYSILVDSDWYDCYLFEAKKTYKEQDILNHYVDSFIYELDRKLTKFKKNKPSSLLQQTVFQMRDKVTDDCFTFASKKPGIYTLTVPTGGGKTFASLNYALHHSKLYNKERIIYVAPYTSIIEQNAKEIRKALKCNDKLLEYHSNVISENKINEFDDENHIKVLSARWDYPIIFTTMVQFLNVIFAKPSQDIRKLHAYINSVIIFDEAQSVPLHCTSLFNEAVNFLNEFLNCTVVLCTATQPALNEVERPLKLSENCEIVSDVQNIFDKLKRVNVIDKTIKGGYSYNDAFNLVKELKKDHLSILVVVNTVKTAEEIFRIIRNNDKKSKLYYLSSNICPSHRLKVINDMKVSLDKKEHVICISTQVIECGVDISFSTVIRSLAGLDSIAQASGRCNRHGETNISNSYIINFNSEYENTGRILNIDIGKKQTINMLELYKNNPSKYNNSLLSNEIIKEYFNRFIRDNNISKELDYILEKEDTTIYKLLSSDSKKKSYMQFVSNFYPLSLCYQFKTARCNFKVIEDNTKSIIVPYNEGVNLIANLSSSIDINEKYEILKTAQLYSVNVFDNKYFHLNKLEAFLPSEVEGVYLLKDGFYDKDLGIVTEKNMDFLNH